MSDLKLFKYLCSIYYFYLGKLFLLTRADIFGLSNFLFLKSFCVGFFFSIIAEQVQTIDIKFYYMFMYNLILSVRIISIH